MAGMARRHGTVSKSLSNGYLPLSNFPF